MALINLKCGKCGEYFDGSKGYTFYRGKGLCPRCKVKIKEELNVTKKELQEVKQTKRKNKKELQEVKQTKRKNKK